MVKKFKLKFIKRKQLISRKNDGKDVPTLRYLIRILLPRQQE